jgi:hypothetical protein
MASWSSGFGSPEVCSEMSFPFCGGNVYVEIIYDNKSQLFLQVGTVRHFLL